MEIFYVFAGLTVLGLIGYGFQIWAVKRTLCSTLPTTDCLRSIDFRQSLKSFDQSAENCKFCPPISILKPLKGLDDNLFDNLASFCTQDYPAYEIIFSLQDYNDPAYKVARKIKDKYPDTNISIVVERRDDGLNPKVKNLISAYKTSEHPYILISDSNVMVDKNYLKATAKHMQDPDVGLVSNIIKGIGGRTIGSLFENLHLNSLILSSVCFLDNFLKMPCVIGKSMLIMKKDLEAIGGFKAVKDVLAEDYVIGERMHKIGKKVALSNYAINNVNEYWGIKKFLNRHTRWGKLRWKLGGIKYISELISNPVFMSCMPMLLLDVSMLTISFALLASLVKILGDLYLGRVIRSDLNPFIYLLSPFKDIVIGLIWFVPLLSNTVVWRGNRYIIGKDSMLSPYPETGMWAWGYRIADAIKAKIA